MKLADGDGSLKDGGHSSEPEASAASGSPCGSPGTLELLAADTQRILRGEHGWGGQFNTLIIPSYAFPDKSLKHTDTLVALPAETAARDRLGKGHKIEIKPLSSILDRIKQRQALAIARCAWMQFANEPCWPGLPSGLPAFLASAHTA